MGVEKDHLTIQAAVAREAQILGDSTGSSSGSDSGSSFSGSRSSSSSSRSGSSRRHNNVRINVSGWVRDRRHSRRRRTTSRTGS